MMNKCIYTLQGSPIASFEKQEHIIPAGIGGMQKLDKGVVSDQANSLFSKWELQFMKNSLIAIPRQLIGPGKRGSLNPTKASKSKVHIFTSEEEQPDAENKFRLGYVKVGIPHHIPQMIITHTSIRFLSDLKEGEHEDQLNELVDLIKKLRRILNLWKLNTRKCRMILLF